MLTQHLKESERLFEEKFTILDPIGIRKVSPIVVTDRTKDEPYFEDDLCRMQKKFFRSRELALVGEIKEKIEGMKKPILFEGTNKDNLPAGEYAVVVMAECYNNAISDISKLLSELTNKK